MKIKNKAMRDLASIVFTLYYLIAAEQADEKVRKVRAVLTVDHLRVSWNKSTTPYLSFFTALLRPKFMRFKPRSLTIARPKDSNYKDPVKAWMYFDGTLKELEQQTCLVLDVPGGGFVAMSPRESDDKLLCWAARLKLPVLSLDYRKAPEYPYPYALNECYDVYRQIVATRGACVGLRPRSLPRIVITGDSAGGNLATGTTLMIIENNHMGKSLIPTPAGLVLLYPALDMNIGSWMSEDQMALIRNPRMRKEYQSFIRRKSEDIDRRYTPSTPKPREAQEDYFTTASRKQDDVEAQQRQVAETKPQQLKTRIAVSSIISYFGDRILTPEMMRAMVILYVGPYNRPDFKTDHLLCPAYAPESLLVKFPKTYFITGERDPLVDDTVFFAGRLRQAKMRLFAERQEVGLESSRREFNEHEHVEVSLIPGISHGFVQLVSIFPEGWRHVEKCAQWIQDIFARPPHSFEGPVLEQRVRNGSVSVGHDTGLDLLRHHSRRNTGLSEDEDEPMSMTRLNMNGHAQPAESRGRGRIVPKANRSKSISSLGSEEDLLKRRMQGLTISLLGSDS